MNYFKTLLQSCTVNADIHICFIDKKYFTDNYHLRQFEPTAADGVFQSGPNYSIAKNSIYFYVLYRAIEMPPHCYQNINCIFIICEHFCILKTVSKFQMRKWYINKRIFILFISKYFYFKFE